MWFEFHLFEEARDGRELWLTDAELFFENRVTEVFKGEAQLIVCEIVDDLFAIRIRKRWGERVEDLTDVTLDLRPEGTSLTVAEIRKTHRAHRSPTPANEEDLIRELGVRAGQERGVRADEIC